MRQFLFVCAALAFVAAGCTSTTNNGASTGANAPRKVTFLCDGGQNIDVIFTDGRATLETANTSVALTQQPSGSGISYAGGGHQLRGKGPDLTWTDASGTAHNCRDQEWAMKQPQIQEPRQELAGTTWRLVHFQSSDDSIGKIVPPNLEKYTLQFMPDGKLAMQLDCNRGNASWKVADVTATSGTLTISPVAMTRAMCGPGAIDTRVARDMEFVRSYTMAGGKLHMALKMDSGIYVWEPVPPAT